MLCLHHAVRVRSFKNSLTFPCNIVYALLLKLFILKQIVYLRSRDINIGILNKNNNRLTQQNGKHTEIPFLYTSEYHCYFQSLFH